VVEILRRLARGQGCTILLVTHDNRILDIADRILVLEDGKLRSFSPALSAEAGHLLTALSHVAGPALPNLWTNLAEPDFLDLLHRLRAEVEQYLNVAEFARKGDPGDFFDVLLESVFGRVAVVIDASSGVLLTGNRVRIKLGDGVAGPNTVSFDVRN